MSYLICGWADNLMWRSNHIYEGDRQSWVWRKSEMNILFTVLIRMNLLGIRGEQQKTLRDKACWDKRRLRVSSVHRLLNQPWMTTSHQSYINVCIGRLQAHPHTHTDIVTSTSLNLQNFTTQSRKRLNKIKIYYKYKNSQLSHKKRSKTLYEIK